MKSGSRMSLACMDGGGGGRYGGENATSSASGGPVADDHSPVHEREADERQRETEQVVEDVGVDQPVGGAVTQPGTIHRRLTGRVVAKYLQLEKSVDKRGCGPGSHHSAVKPIRDLKWKSSRDQNGERPLGALQRSGRIISYWSNPRRLGGARHLGYGTISTYNNQIKSELNLTK